MTVINLDKIAATCAQAIVNEKDVANLETLITKALGVLQEQGVYALMLFLLSRKGGEKEVAARIKKELIALLEEVPGLKELPGLNELQPESCSFQYILKFYSDQISIDLDRLFLVRDLYERTLIYARYGAKALSKSQETASPPAPPEHRSDTAPAVPA